MNVVMWRVWWWFTYTYTLGLGFLMDMDMVTSSSRVSTVIDRVYA